ncbi:MAG TPA: hypothetical protein VEL47_06775 [Myxococcota bacterium]|nr:hypothetical protein [Myxococcota bacterium]
MAVKRQRQNGQLLRSIFRNFMVFSRSADGNVVKTAVQTAPALHVIELFKR